MSSAVVWSVTYESYYNGESTSDIAVYSSKNEAMKDLEHQFKDAVAQYNQECGVDPVLFNKDKPDVHGNDDPVYYPSSDGMGFSFWINGRYEEDHIEIKVTKCPVYGKFAKTKNGNRCSVPVEQNSGLKTTLQL